MPKIVPTMTTNDWLKQIQEAGLLCDEYTDKVELAMNKTQLIDLAFDANGISYIPEMQAKGYPIPYDTIIKEFGSYINGRYVRDKNGYTSALYCKYAKPVILEETLTCFLGCKGINITVPDYYICEIFLDAECDVKLYLGTDSFVRVNMWKGAKLNLKRGFETQVMYKYHV